MRCDFIHISFTFRLHGAPRFCSTVQEHGGVFMSAPGMPLDATRLRSGAAPLADSSWDAASWIERITGGVLLLGALPLLVPVACAVRLLSRRAPLVAHERVGKNGRVFWMLKIRTMWDREPAASPSGIVEPVRSEGVPARKCAADPRVTSRLAAFCRRHSLDELPQLWHVVTGEMSLVGPRPMTPIELNLYYGKDAAEVTSILPGLSGLWQVSGRSRLTYAQRRRLDLFLVRKKSPGLCFRILLRTCREVISGRNAL